MSDETDKEFLRVLAQDVLDALTQQKYGTPFRLHQKPSRLYKSDTGGWIIEIGRLIPGKCYLQIWLDRFTRYRDRKIWYGFFFEDSDPIERLSKSSRKNLGRAMALGDKDLTLYYEADHYSTLLNRKLQEAEFGRPVIECYHISQCYYYGIYEFDTPPRIVVQRRQLAERIADFFETVARSLPNTTPPNIERDIYPGHENRKIVETHTRRERRSYLATIRKQQDNYQCQICMMRFEDVYGAIGHDFAEAHHIVPLSKIEGTTSTRIEDLITVCSNCHRMLHRLDGEQGDVQKLKKIFKQQRLKVRTQRSV